MVTLTVALLQLAPAGCDVEANLRRGLAGCERAAELGADVAVLPELWQIGFTPCPDDPSERGAWLRLAINLGDRWLEAFAEAARELGVAVVVTFLQRWVGGPRNAAVVIDRHGRPVLTYAKVHTCDFAWEATLTPGDGFPVAELDTRAGPVRVGVMICYDREFPESGRVLMLQGAEVVLVPNACHLTDDRVWQLRTRAYENMMAVAMANYPAPVCNGRSCAFDGISCAEIDGPPRDHRIVEAGPDEGIVLAAIDLEALRAYRAVETWGDAYRKPYAYRPIAATEAPSPPFVRPDARRSRNVERHNCPDDHSAEGMPQKAGGVKGAGWAVTPSDLELLYNQNPDPWGYTQSWYERRKRELTVASLPRERYRRCYEPGCSIGELTKLLAPRCDEVLAVDCATVAVRRAREATRDLAHVRVERAVLPRELPDGDFDLIVLSELLSFFSGPELRAVIGAVIQRLLPDGDLLAVTARPQPNWPGSDLHRLLRDRPQLLPLVHHEDEDFILDVLRRTESDQGRWAPASAGRPSA